MKIELVITTCTVTAISSLHLLKHKRDVTNSVYNKTHVFYVNSKLSCCTTYLIPCIRTYTITAIKVVWQTFNSTSQRWVKYYIGFNVDIFHKTGRSYRF